jgi:hypothetical protein
MRTWNLALSLAPLALVLCLPPGPARAERGEHACRDDIQKFCADVQPGGRRYLECLQKHAADLSPVCLERVKRKQAAIDRLKQICQPDMQKLCADVPPGEGSMFSCLRQHRDQVSQDCKDQIALAHYRRHHRYHHADGKPAATPGMSAAPSSAPPPDGGGN